jgi:hypothetical protein
MKKNGGIIIVVIVLLLISAYFLFFKNKFNTIGEKDNQFAVADTGSVTKICIADRNNHSVTLTRVTQGLWKVNDKYFVRSDAINTLLYTMKTVSVKALVDKAVWDKTIKNMASTAVKVDIYTGGKGDTKIKSYFVGTPTNDHLGTFMLLVNPNTDENYKQPYITYIPGFDGFLNTRYFVEEEGWRDRTILRYYPNEIKSVTLNYPIADHSFTITTIAKNKFTIQNPDNHKSMARFDTNAVRQYLTYFQFVAWEVVVNPDKKDSIIASTPICIMDIKDTLGANTNIRLYNRKAPPNVNNKYGKDYVYDPDRLYALVNGKDFVLVQYFVFGKLLQDPTYFVHKD